MSQKTIKILTFNLALLDIRFFGFHIVKPAEYMTERLALIPGNILNMNADILAFQEVYTKEHQDFLVEQLKKQYPFYSRSDTYGLRLNGGLMTFSKFPITESKYIPFKWNTIDEMIVVQRGFLSNIIDIDGLGKVSFINTHMTAGGAMFDQDDPEARYLRHKQMKQIYKKIVQNKNATIVFGDFNCGPNISIENYTFLLRKKYKDSFEELNKDVVDKDTWDPSIYLNKNGYFKNSIKQRADHIFIPESLLDKVTLVNSKIIFRKPVVSIDNNDIHLSDHFGVITEVDIL